MTSQESHLDKMPSSEKEGNRTHSGASCVDPARPLPSTPPSRSFLWGAARLSGNLVKRLALKHPIVRTKVIERGQAGMQHTAHTHTPTHPHPLTPTFIHTTYLHPLILIYPPTHTPTYLPISPHNHPPIHSHSCPPTHTHSHPPNHTYLPTHTHIHPPAPPHLSLSHTLLQGIPMEVADFLSNCPH